MFKGNTLICSFFDNIYKEDIFIRNINNPKLIEPVYIGDPDSYYYMQSLNHYNKEIIKIKDFKIWKEEISQYCITDCISLHQILTSFNKLVFDKWKVNITKYPTIPSLAFAIFRVKYLIENQVPITTGKVYNFIKDSFTGGSTEMYKPSGSNIYCYDVNSLYPSVMKNNKFPCGMIYQFLEIYLF